MFVRRILFPLVIASLVAAGPGMASAAMLYSDTVLVRGTDLDIIEFDVAEPGDYLVDVTDLRLFDTPFAALQFGVFQESTQIGDTVTGSGALALFLGARGKAFVQIYARTLTPDTFNLYSVNISSAGVVVPLPASVYMLLSGLCLLYTARRRRAAVRAAGEEMAPEPA